MTLDRWDRAAIGASLAANGYLRRSPYRDGGRPGHREWLHFTVHGSGARLVLNASVVDDLRPAASTHRERVRVLAMVQDAGGWHGDVVDLDAADLRGGQLCLQLGALAISSRGDTISIRGAVGTIELELELVAQTFPSLASGVAIGEGPPINWLVIPHLAATGRIGIGNHIFELAGAPAYHDHNWGFFSHRDFSWQWGHDGGGGDHTVVFARLLDGAQTTTFMQSLLVWSGPRQARVFRSDELLVEPSGFLRPPRPFTLPRTASLLVDGLATEVPSCLRITASADGDALEGAFVADTVARIVVPHDDRSETTVIHEVCGRLQLRGSLHDRDVTIAAPAMFEFLRGGT
ncbi:MAG: hypothetical protein ACKV2T_19475 [Kofleriaceae bacterium]